MKTGILGFIAAMGIALTSCAPKQMKGTMITEIPLFRYSDDPLNKLSLCAKELERPYNRKLLLPGDFQTRHNYE
jgi:hypothetical protein